MWDAAKQEEFDELRHRQQESALTDEERQTLEQFLYELDQEEWRALGPELERLRQERVQLQQQCTGTRTQNAVLTAIAERQADLMARAKGQLTILVNEQAILNSELERALGQSSSDAR
jgi:Mg2+ and Co2+ transporter CorA